MVDVFEPKAGGGEKYLTQLTGPEPGVSFADVIGVAVDQSERCDVLVAEAATQGVGENAVDVFEPDGRLGMCCCGA